MICLESPADTCWAAAGVIALAERSVPDVRTLADRLSLHGAERERIARVVRALTPFAESLHSGRSAAAGRTGDVSKRSFWKKLLG